MIREVKDPIPVLEGAVECLLLGYRYDAAEGSLELVTDYWKPSSEVRPFLRVRFGNVSNFKRIRGLWAEVQRFTSSYSARADPAAFVVQSVRIEQEVRLLRIFLGFGGDFGGIEFSCESISAHVRNTRATKRKDEDWWDYRDADDGTPLDFYEPFNDPFG